MNQKLFAIFDIDGTLHKTHVMSVHAYNAVMPKLGLEVPPLEVLTSTYGCNDDGIMERLGIPADLREAFMRAIEPEEDRQLARCGVCYDGVEDALHRLHGDGVVLGVCSMCSPGYMQVFLDRFGLDGMIPYRRNESHGSVKTGLLRELLDECGAELAVMVGDRAFDLDAARANGIPTIGCLYGYAPDEVRDAERTIDSAEELYDAVRAVLGY